MHIGFFITGKALLLIALILFCHDMLNLYEFGEFLPTTPVELYYLFIEGKPGRMYTNGSSVFDTLASSAGFLVFGIVGSILYILFRNKGKTYN